MRGRLALAVAVAALLAIPLGSSTASAWGPFGTPGSVLWTDPQGDAQDPQFGTAPDLDLRVGAAEYDPTSNELRFFLTVTSLKTLGGDETTAFYDWEVHWQYQGTTYFTYMAFNNVSQLLEGPYCGSGTLNAAGLPTVQSATTSTCNICPGTAAGGPGYIEIGISATDSGIRKLPATGVTIGSVGGFSYERSFIEYYDHGNTMGPGVPIDSSPVAGSWTLSSSTSTQQFTCAPQPGADQNPAPLTYPLPGTSTVRTNRVLFTHPALVDPERFASGPSATYDSSGSLYAAAPEGDLKGENLLYKSVNGGAQFSLQRCNSEVDNSTCSASGGLSGVATGTQQPPPRPGFPSHPPALYFGSLSSGGALTCAYSYDGGSTMAVSGPAVAQPAGLGQACGANSSTRGAPVAAERPWVAVYRSHGSVPTDTVYALYRSPAGLPVLLRSTDAGQNYVQVSGPTTFGTDIAGVGNLAVDQRNGNVYAFMSTADPVGGKYGVAMFVSHDSGATFARYPVSGATTSASTANAYPRGTLDTSGNVYLVWATAATAAHPWQTVYYAHSTDAAGPYGIHGRSWIKPQALTGAGSLLSHVSAGALPTIAAGTQGRVDVAFYGTQHGLPYDPTADSGTWNVYFLQTIGGLVATPGWTAATPPVGSSVLAPGVTTPLPVHQGSICPRPASCRSATGFGAGDTVDMAIDSAGRATVFYTDDSSSTAGGGGSQVKDVQQASGRSLFSYADGGLGYVTSPARSLSQSVDIRSRVVDPGGDARWAFNPAVDDTWQDVVALSASQVTKSTLRFTITLNIGKGFNSWSGCALFVALFPGTECSGTASWLVVWEYAGSYYFAGVKANIAPCIATCVFGTPVAGRPTPVPGAGYVFDQDPALTQKITMKANPETHVHDISFDVPLAAVGSPSSGRLLRSVQAVTMLGTSAPSPVAPSQPFEYVVDTSPPFDYALGVVSGAGGGLPLSAASAAAATSAGTAWTLRSTSPAGMHPTGRVARLGWQASLPAAGALALLLFALPRLLRRRGPLRRRLRGDTSPPSGEEAS